MKKLNLKLRRVLFRLCNEMKYMQISVLRTKIYMTVFAV